MKILLVSNTDWYLFRFRLSLARFLRAQGEEVTLVSPPGDYAAQIQSEGFRWLAWEVGRKSVNPFGELSAMTGLAKIFRTEKPDLVHLHTIKPVMYGSLVARWLGWPAVVRSITGRGYVFLSSDAKARILRPMVKAVYRVALGGRRGVTIFENETDRQYFVDEGIVTAEHSLVIAGVGVDMDYFSPQPEPTGTPVVVLASRMLWDKGVGTFVDAARLLRERGVSARFVLVGQPDAGNPANIEEEQLKRWNADGAVEWRGFQSDMRAVFAGSHIVALPSFGEGLPTVLLEAASSGRPIVTTDVSGCRDVVSDGVNGLVVSPRDPSALADALERLIVDAEARRVMGQAGRDLVAAKFSNAIVHRETVEAYRGIASHAKA
jgi:glycosyltransferase involved in cell wall biosynthesis